MRRFDCELIRREKLSPGAIQSVLSILRSVLGCATGRGPLTGPISVMCPERSQGRVHILAYRRRGEFARCLLQSVSPYGFKILLTLLAKLQVKRMYTLG